MMHKKAWDHGYVLPEYIKKEDPFKKGSAVTTPQIPGKTIGTIPKGFKLGGYAVPQYIRDEPLGSHAHTTPQLPGGTYDAIPGMDKVFPWSTHTLMSNGLGSYDHSSLSGHSLQASMESGDPIKDYGKNAAKLIMQTAMTIPQKDRGLFIQETLKGIDPKLPLKFLEAANQAKSWSMPAEDIVPYALSHVLKKGIVEELVNIGKGKAPRKNGQVALALGRAAESRELSGYEPVGLFGVSIPNPLDVVKDIGEGIVDATKYVGGKTKDAAQYIGSKTKDAASAIADKVGDVIDKITDMACGVANHPSASLAAGAGAAAYGAPPQAGEQGAMMVQSLCNGPQQYAPPPKPAMPGWVIPAAIGGGVLLLVLVVKK